MASAPIAEGKNESASCTSRVAPAPKPPQKLCEECGERESTFFCKFCHNVSYCVECDAAVHVRARKDHVRVPADQRPPECSIHNKLVEAYCAKEQRLVCGSCLMVGVGTCADHAKDILTIDKAAIKARTALSTVEAELSQDVKKITDELSKIEELRMLLDERTACLQQGVFETTGSLTSLAALHTQPDMNVLDQMGPSLEQVEQMRAGLQGLLSGEWQWLARLRTASSTLAPVILASPAKAGPLDLLALPAPRSVACAGMASPTEAREALDGASVYVANWDGMPALQIWLNNSQVPAPVANTAKANIVLPVEDGLVLLRSDSNIVERTGPHAWKRTDINKPFSAVVAGTSIVVSENGVNQVVRLDLRTGATLGVYGKGVLKSPCGIAVGASGEILVASSSAKSVTVLDSQGTFVRTLGLGLLQCPQGICVDTLGRLYVADWTSNSIVVLDCATGARIASIATNGKARGVSVTKEGDILICTRGPDAMLVFSRANAPAPV
eukprot:m.32268 g.32268  ORF g.32268 m.32268 type:complete len:499 (-) comp9380_c0_seq1:21-1517(-)